MLWICCTTSCTTNPQQILGKLPIEKHFWGKRGKCLQQRPQQDHNKSKYWSLDFDKLWTCHGVAANHSELLCHVTTTSLIINCSCQFQSVVPVWLVVEHELYYLHLLHIYSIHHKDLVGISHHMISSEILYPRIFHTISLHSLIIHFPLLPSANHRCRASCTSTCSAHLPVLGLYGFPAQRCLALSITGIDHRPACHHVWRSATHARQ